MGVVREVERVGGARGWHVGVMCGVERGVECGVECRGGAQGGSAGRVRDGSLRCVTTSHGV